MTDRILVAGVGNLFKHDDGFGSAVAERLAGEPLPEGVEVVDYGIRGVHLAYQLLDGYDLLLIVDAVERGGTPGTLYVIEPDLSGLADADASEPTMVDAHDMSPQAVLALVPALGGSLGRVLVVGCEPETVADGMGLSEPVRGAVEEAALMVLDLLAQETSDPATIAGGSM